MNYVIKQKFIIEQYNIYCESLWRGAVPFQCPILHLGYCPSSAWHVQLVGCKLPSWHGKKRNCFKQWLLVVSPCLIILRSFHVSCWANHFKYTHGLSWSHIVLLRAFAFQEGSGKRCLGVTGCVVGPWCARLSGQIPHLRLHSAAPTYWWNGDCRSSCFLTWIIIIVLQINYKSHII